MKKIVLIVVALCWFAVSQYNHADKKASEERPKTLLEQARTPDGKIDLTVIMNSKMITNERKAAFSEGDVNGDGFLDEEEYANIPEMASKYAEALRVKAQNAKDTEEIRNRLLSDYAEMQGWDVSANPWFGQIPFGFAGN